MEVVNRERVAPEEETTPRKTRKVPVLPREEFDAYIDKLVEQERKLREASAEVYALPKSKSFTIPPSDLFPRFKDPFSFGRVELKSLYTEHQKSLKYLKRLYAAAYEYKEKKPVKKKPAVFTNALVDFFKSAELGPVYVYNEEDNMWDSTDEPLITALPLFAERGIAYTETVITLFFIYSIRNNLRVGNCYHADEKMLEYLGPTFQAIIDYDMSRPKKPRKPSTGKRNGVCKESGETFDPQSFGITGFNRIARWTRWFKPEERDIPGGAPVLTDEQIEQLSSPELAEQMEREFTETENAKLVNRIRRKREEALEERRE